jgi:hypothetical protein
MFSETFRLDMHQIMKTMTGRAAIDEVTLAALTTT